MPYPNEHAARLRDPARRFTSTPDKVAISASNMTRWPRMVWIQRVMRSTATIFRPASGMVDSLLCAVIVGFSRLPARRE